MISEYKVIMLLNKKEILINYGIQDGAKKGDKLKIIERGEEVIHWTKNNEYDTYGYLDATKEIVEVKIAYPTFSLCSKIEKVKYDEILSPLGALAKSIRENSGYEFTNNEYEVDLNIEESQISNISLPKITPIKINDVVQKI